MEDDILSELCDILEYNKTDLDLVIQRGNYKMFSTREAPEYMIRVYKNNNIPVALLKFENEAFILNKMQKYKKIPTPDLILSQNSDKSTSILVMEKLSGLPLHEAWNYLETESQYDIAYDLGKILSNLHHIEQPGFGNPNRFIENWKEFLSSRLEENLKVLKEYLHSKTKNKVRKLLDDWMNNEDDVKPAIVHGDLNPHNILISEVDERPVISGIIDWEWSFAGECVYDLVEIESLFLNSFEIVNGFFKGYGGNISKGNWNLKRKIYYIDRFLQIASYDVITENYSSQQHKLTKFLLNTILK